MPNKSKSHQTSLFDEGDAECEVCVQLAGSNSRASWKLCSARSQRRLST